MDAEQKRGGTGAEPPPGRQRPSKGGERQASARAGGPALEAMYQLLLWLIPTLEKFPRSQKFTLGDHIQRDAQGVLDHLITATFTRDREQALRAANLGLERMRYGVRLAKDLRYLSFSGYEHAARGIDAVGRLVGGWIKTDSARGPGSATGPGAGDRGRDAAPA